MDLFDLAAILIGKLFSFASTVLHIGSGATWPGEIALRLRPHILTRFNQQKKTIIFVAGTNGKTTTSKMIDTILQTTGKKVYRNESGANLDNGIVSAFIKDASIFGKLRSNYFIFEVDEAALSILLKQLIPDILILMNLFRDQLDRYGEVDAIAEKWLQSLSHLSNHTRILINGDDPQLTYIGYTLEKMRNELPGNKQVHRLKHPDSTNNDTIQYFGLNDERLYLPRMEHATDSIYCPQCGNRLTFGGTYFSHLGKWACGQCGFMHPDLSVVASDYSSPLEGVYNKYNTLAAALTALQLGISPELIRQALSTFIPAFGRLEEVTYQNRNIKILLSKNPTGWNESMRTVLTSRQKGVLVLVLNDRIPDGRDVSWIWDTDMEMLSSYSFPVIVSGDRCFDLGLRLKYAGVPSDTYFIYEDLERSIETALSKSKESETIWILPTYSAMLEVRKIITGKKIL